MNYKLDCYLNQIPDGEINLSVDDIAVLEITAYDVVGNDWESGWTATLYVRRNDRSSVDQWEIDELVELSPQGDNVYYFNLEDLNFERGDYEAHLVLEGSWDMDIMTPVSSVYSFESFKIYVRD
jgi:hypothetical protein